jgi:hypothetical protein
MPVTVLEVAVAAWVSATPFAFARVSVVVEEAVATKTPLFAALSKLATVNVKPANAFDPPPVIVPV